MVWCDVVWCVAVLCCVVCASLHRVMSCVVCCHAGVACRSHASHRTSNQQRRDTIATCFAQGMQLASRITRMQLFPASPSIRVYVQYVLCASGIPGIPVGRLNEYQHARGYVSLCMNTQQSLFVTPHLSSTQLPHLVLELYEFFCPHIPNPVTLIVSVRKHLRRHPTRACGGVKAQAKSRRVSWWTGRRVEADEGYGHTDMRRNRGTYLAVSVSFWNEFFPQKLVVDFQFLFPPGDVTVLNSQVTINTAVVIFSHS